MVTALKNFLAELEQTSVGGRPLTKVVLDVKTGKVEMAFEKDKNLDMVSLQHYESLYVADRKAWASDFAKWKRHHYNRASREDCKELMYKELEKLLQSGVLLPEDDMLNRVKIKKAGEALQKMQIDMAYAEKYALLLDLVPIQNDMYSFEDTSILDNYLDEMKRRHSEDSILALLRFKYAMQMITEQLAKIEMTSTLSDDDRALLDSLLYYVDRGDWQAPATTENVTSWLSTLFGAKPALLDSEDREQARAFRAFFKGGRSVENARREIAMANVIGFLMRNRYLDGGPQPINKMFFKDKDQLSNINKGKGDSGSQAYQDLVPFMDKYRLKIIAKSGQVQSA